MHIIYFNKETESSTAATSHIRRLMMAKQPTSQQTTSEFFYRVCAGLHGLKSQAYQVAIDIAVLGGGDASDRKVGISPHDMTELTKAVEDLQRICKFWERVQETSDGAVIKARDQEGR